MSGNNGQETPYQKALKECPPIPNGTAIRYKSSIPGDMGRVLGHKGVYNNNIFNHWEYIIVPYGFYHNGHYLMTIEVSQENIYE